MRLVAHRGYDAVIDTFDGSAGIMGRVMRTGEVAFVPDVSLDPDYLSADDAIKAEISAPLKVGSELIGVVNVEAPEVNGLDRSDREDGPPRRGPAGLSAGTRARARAPRDPRRALPAARDVLVDRQRNARYRIALRADRQRDPRRHRCRLRRPDRSRSDDRPLQIRALRHGSDADLLGKEVRVPARASQVGRSAIGRSWWTTDSHAIATREVDGPGRNESPEVVAGVGRPARPGRRRRRRSDPRPRRGPAVRSAELEVLPVLAGLTALVGHEHAAPRRGDRVVDPRPAQRPVQPAPPRRRALADGRFPRAPGARRPPSRCRSSCSISTGSARSTSDSATRRATRSSASSPTSCSSRMRDERSRRALRRRGVRRRPRRSGSRGGDARSPRKFATGSPPTPIASPDGSRVSATVSAGCAAMGADLGTFATCFPGPTWPSRSRSTAAATGS